MNTAEVIKKFYTAFAEGDASKMIDCYHEDIVFHDPAFGELKGQRARSMWKMLLSQKSATTIIKHSNIHTTNDHGKVDWTAEYLYGNKNRKVVNIVQAEFKFRDNKIIKHNDIFDLWKWSKQALGTSGHLLGWTSFMKNKIQKTTSRKLDRFIEKHGL